MMLARAKDQAPRMQTDEERHAVSAIHDEFAEHRAAFQWFLEHDSIADAGRLVPRDVSILPVSTCAGGAPMGVGGRRPARR